MICRSRSAVLLAGVFAPGLASGGTQVLLRSGDVAPDGTVFSSFGGLVSTSPGVVVFRGTTSALLTRSGSAFGVVARTGDPFPAPFAGTFNDFFDVAINIRVRSPSGRAPTRSA